MGHIIRFFLNLEYLFDKKRWGMHGTLDEQMRWQGYHRRVHRNQGDNDEAN